MSTAELPAAATSVAPMEIAYWIARSCRAIDERGMPDPVPKLMLITRAPLSTA